MCFAGLCAGLGGVDECLDKDTNDGEGLSGECVWTWERMASASRGYTVGSDRIEVFLGDLLSLLSMSIGDGLRDDSEEI